MFVSWLVRNKQLALFIQHCVAFPLSRDGNGEETLFMKSNYETMLYTTYAKEIVEHFTSQTTPNIYSYSGVKDAYSDNKRKLSNGYASFRVVEDPKSSNSHKNYFLLGNSFYSTYTNLDGETTSYKVATFLKPWLIQMSKSRNKAYIPNIILCSNTDGKRTIIEIDGVALLRDFKDGKLRTTFNIPSSTRKAIIVDTPFENYVVKVTRETNKQLTPEQHRVYRAIKCSKVSSFAINNNILSDFFAYVYDKSTGLLLKRIEVEDVQKFVASFSSSKGTVSKRLKDNKVFKGVLNGKVVYVRLSKDARSDFEERAETRPEATPEIVKKLRETGKTFSEVAKILHKRKADVIALYKQFFADLETAQTAILLQMTSDEEKPQVEAMSKTRIKMKNDEIDEDVKFETEDWAAKIRQINLNNFKRA